jgi:hypothetical protein
MQQGDESMGSTRQWIPAGGLLTTIAAAGYAVVQLNGQAQAPTGDFTNAATAFVRDAQGQTVLQGQFTAPVEEDGDLERRAALTPSGSDADAAGEAEVEFAKTGATTQEVEFTGAEPAAGHHLRLRHRWDGRRFRENRSARAC